MIDAFLSYRRNTGTEFCSFLHEHLSVEGYNVFFDNKSIRQGEFDVQIDKAISECTFVLVLLAPHDLDRCIDSPDKDWIVHEVSLAIEYGKIVIPIAIKQGFSFPDSCCQIPALEYLSKQEICDLSGPDAASNIKTILFDFMQSSPYTSLREKYQRTLLTQQYQEWEIRTLQSIYPEFDFVQEFNRVFPVVVMEGSEAVQYPFDALNRIQNLEEIGDPIEIVCSDTIDDFRRIVGPNIHFPNLYGFTNVGIITDACGKINGFHAKPRTYKETVFSSHVLHFELWRAYSRIGNNRGACLNDLPIRKQIHGDRQCWDVLLSGCNRSSLCDVCIAVLAYDEIEEDYDIAIATRSDKVACYPGYLSIVPSGGFELYELEERQNALLVKKNFSIVAALYREYIEEIFGEEAFDSPTGNDDLKRLYRNPHIRELRNAIGEKCHFEFVGATFDVISLRPTFTFVLRIDDPKFLYENEIRKNKENSDVRFLSLRDFEEYVKENAQTSPLMAESAGVYRLLKSNHLFREALRSGN